MGLIKTVFSPFTNTTPLVTIILVVILVAVFRFSNGGIKVEDAKNVNALKAQNVKMVKETKRNNGLPSEGTIKIDAKEFESMLRLRKPKERVENNVEKEDKPVNTFDSIEADLGLR